MNLAIIHDFLNQFGGAERVVEAVHTLYPEAPIYTSIYDQSRLPDSFARMDIRTSFMQNLPLVMRYFKLYFMIYPLAFEQIKLDEYDVILSSSSAYAKGVKTSPNQLHICYCHTPMRFVWRFNDYIKRENLPDWVKNLLPFFLEPIKEWDLRNNSRVDYFIANSSNVAARIKQLYGRQSDIIFPPVDTKKFQPGSLDKDFFLVVSRLSPYKRLDLVVEAFNQLDLPLKIIGSGPARASLQKLAKNNIEFLGQLDDRDVVKYLSECRALIFPGEEDFGIVPLEAMACGRPVIAYKAGGVLETVLPGTTGLFFPEPSSRSLMQAVKQFQFMVFDKAAIRQQAMKFDLSVFEKKLADYVKEKYEQKRARS